MNTSRHEHGSSNTACTAVVFAVGMALVAALPATAQDATGTPQSPGTMNSTTPSTGKKPLSEASREFIKKAAQSGLKEVRLSRLAAERTSNSDVRQLAQTLINDHQTANAHLASIANERGVMVPLDTAAASMRMDDSKTTKDDRSGRPAGAAADTTPAVERTPNERAGSAMQGSNSVKADHGQADASYTEAHKEIQDAVEKLSSKTGEEFDRSFVDIMVEDHKKAIDLFEKEANETSDPRVAQFAQNTLPTLRNHLSRAQALQQQLEG